MIPRNPTDDLPSTPEHSCDIGGCHEPWADEVEAWNGPRRLRLCEEHHDRWTKAEAELRAEIEEVAGRTMQLGTPKPGTVDAIERRYGLHQVGPRRAS